MNLEYYYAVDGKRSGPVSFEALRELATRAELKRSDLVWCRGMKAWESAKSVEKLFEDLPPDLDFESDLMPPPLPPEAKAPKKELPSLKEPVEGAVQQSILAAPLNGQTDALATEFMKQERQIFMIGYPIGIVFIAMAKYFNEEVSGTSEEIVGVICFWLGFVGLAMAIFNWMKVHHRLWKLIPPAFAPTTPAKAVGFYFIPIFNIYWAFITFDGLVNAANKTLLALKETRLRGSEGLAIAFSATQAVLLSGIGNFVPVLGLLVLIVSYVLWIIWYGDLAKCFVVIQKHAALSNGATRDHQAI